MGLVKEKAHANGIAKCVGNIVRKSALEQALVAADYRSRLSRFLAMLRKPILPSSNS